MANVYTTEITSDKLPSDNPIHQRLFKAYVLAKDYVSGNLLEVGCGEGRGIETLSPFIDHYSAIDKLTSVIQDLGRKYPKASLQAMNIPPFTGLHDNSFDFVVSFQVIEHIKNDKLFLEEIERVLKPGGKALLTTPNRKMSLSRNPWHVREYLADELSQIAAKVFSKVTMKGITGNEKVLGYYEENKKSVKKFTRWDIFNLQHKLPASWLRIPYEILNRWNRNKLQGGNHQLVTQITHEDYLLTNDAENALDLFLIVEKG